MLTYTNIQHEFRKLNDLSLTEYVLCDMIYHLHVKPTSKIPGWCYAKRTTLADEIGISRSGIHKIIVRLVQRNFLIKDDETKYLKTTQNWQEVYFIQRTQHVSKGDTQRLQKTHVNVSGGDTTCFQKTHHNNNTNNNKKDKQEVPLFEKTKKQAAQVVYPFNEIEFIHTWRVWKQYKKEQHNFKYKGVISEQAALTSLAKYANSNMQTAIKIIQQSIANSWQGFFQLKENVNEKGNSTAEQNAQLWNELRDEIIASDTQQ
jgi:predicted transcriptional regulator